MKQYEDHPFAAIFPMMTDSEIAELAEDIKANGMNTRIAIFDGKVLDGRNRMRACQLAGIEPQVGEWKGRDPLAFVISQNLRRRQLTASQRAMVATEIETLKHGGERGKTPAGRLDISSENANESSVSRKMAAEQMHVGERTVARAAAVAKSDPVKAEQVKAGEKSLRQAEREVKAAAEPASSGNPRLVYDARGTLVPADKIESWNRRDEMGKLARLVSQVRVAIRKAKEDRDPVYANLEATGTLAHLDQAYHALSSCTPHCVCPMCQGEGCRACQLSGFMGKFQFDTICPKEFKKSGE